MKKILFITTRDPYSKKYSGDVLRSNKIINLLKKKYKLDILCFESKKSLPEQNLIYFKPPNYFFKIFYCLFSLFKFLPIQFGLFFSKEMKEYVEDYANNYDYIFFYHIRSIQYLPKDFNGRTIIEMGDLYSENYTQTYNYLSFMNPLKYIYFLESILVKKAEKEIFENFDRIILFSKNEVKKINRNFKHKIFQINESIDKINKKFLFKKDNFKILFIGNINYLPNFLACRDFKKNILPKLKKKIPKIKFYIIGNINSIYKFLLSSNDIEILGPKKNLQVYLKSSICGLANLEIATGVQGKVLTYMSYGLPIICSEKVANNFKKNVISYNSNPNLIRNLVDLKNNKIKSNKFSNKSINFSKKLDWKKVGLQYLRVLDF